MITLSHHARRIVAAVILVTGFLGLAVGFVGVSGPAAAIGIGRTATMATTTATSPPPGSAGVSPAYMVATVEGNVVPFGDAGNFGSFTQPPPATVAEASPPGTTGGGLTGSASATGSTTMAPPAAGSTSTTESAVNGSPATSWSPISAGSPVVSAAALQGGTGYWLSTANGGVFSFGSAGYFGSAGQLDPNEAPGGANALHLAKSIVAMAATPDSQGYWLVGADGGVFCFGDAAYQGSLGQLDPNKAPGGANALHLADSIVAIAATPDAQGYWLVDTAGAVYAFGDAAYRGSMGQLDPTKAPGHANAAPDSYPIVAIAATPDAQGYWLVDTVGAVYTFGDAAYRGSTGQLDPTEPPGGSNAATLARSVVAVASTSDGRGYWIESADGGVYAFGDASFSGSASGHVAAHDAAVSLVATQPYVDGGSAAARQAVAFALSQVGQPYLYGGTGTGGYDCSGLVMVSFANAGVILPRQAQEQFDADIELPAGLPLLPGDVVFFGTGPTGIQHDGIYIGNGQMVDAPHTGADVRVESYQWDDYVGATRPAP